MNLYDKLLKIQYDNGLNTTEFLDITGFSKGMYYSIKDGSKTDLKPVQLKRITECFPEVDINWLSEVEQKNTLSEENELYFFNGQHIDLEDLGDFVEVHFEEVKKASRLFNLRVQTEQKEYAIQKLIEMGILGK